MTNEPQIKARYSGYEVLGNFEIGGLYYLASGPLTLRCRKCSGTGIVRIGEQDESQLFQLQREEPMVFLGFFTLKSQDGRLLSYLGQAATAMYPVFLVGESIIYYDLSYSHLRELQVSKVAK